MWLQAGLAWGASQGLHCWACPSFMQSQQLSTWGGASSPHCTGVLGAASVGCGPQWMGLGPQRGLVGPQVPTDLHSRPIPETEETMRGVAPGPPSRGRSIWTSLRKAAPLTWIRPPCSARLSSWAAAGRPGGLVGRAGGHRHHTRLAALFQASPSNLVFSTLLRCLPVPLTRRRRPEGPPRPCGQVCLP